MLTTLDIKARNFLFAFQEKNHHSCFSVDSQRSWKGHWPSHDVTPKTTNSDTPKQSLFGESKDYLIIIFATKTCYLSCTHLALKPHPKRVVAQLHALRMSTISTKWFVDRLAIMGKICWWKWCTLSLNSGKCEWSKRKLYLGLNIHSMIYGVLD